MAVQSDSFHLLSDTRALFLKHLGALLQDCGELSAPAIQAIQNGAGAYFDEMASTNRRGTFAEEASGLTSSRITLVGEEDLELGIRLDNMSARLFESTGGSLWRTHLRFVTLLRRPDLPKSANPIGPKGIAQGLTTMFDAAGAATIDKKLELLDRIEACLLEGLPALYAEINDFMDRKGVDAASPSIIGSQEGPTSTEPSSTPDNALLALQQRLLASLPRAGELAPAAGGAAASLLNQATLERLVERLNELDRRGAFEQKFAPTQTGGGMIPALFTPNGDFASPPKVLKSAQLGIPTTANEGLAIDTLAMIFEAIFANPAVPDALKAVISSLQITLLKVAMKDSSLFVDAQHPARLVVDRMGQAILGLPIDVPARHPICARLFEIATRLRSESSADKSAFETALNDLDTLLAEHNASFAAATTPYLPLVNQLDRNDEAALRVRQALEKFIETSPPPAIRLFLEQTWSRLLRTIWLEAGEQGAEWQEGLAVVDDLLWTIQPKADPDERKTLARRLPEILKRLRAGMARIGLSAEAEAAFLDTCFELQTRALRATPATTPETPAADLFPSGVSTPAGTPVSGKLQADQRILATLDFADYRPAPSRAFPVKVGDWLEFPLADGSQAMARLCYISPASRRALLINPESGLALAVHPAILERQLREGEARLSPLCALFESAASIALQKSAGG
ncbi:MAG: DUF1631 domain-containing protein [Gammaproteobacteria bacterium]|nr:DUF1631 domain-containing protein [Gammaproteobacteria bacterium]MBU1600855.1 DUF1631 domain-containing protein [Gammaproteobacteria bacterium]MBU2435311.1 DUF1631 domain-containing protein [Gammaproteobacteria bacterium]MBU2448725.1 DUF1631 domain-containing protein [Gammaproteobacteria bacterium]